MSFAKISPVTSVFELLSQRRTECVLHIVYLILVVLQHILQQQTPTPYNSSFLTIALLLWTTQKSLQSSSNLMSAFNILTRFHIKRFEDADPRNFAALDTNAAGKFRLPFLALVGYVQRGCVFVLLLLLMGLTPSRDIE
jgi:hypothetical protein